MQNNLLLLFNEKIRTDSEYFVASYGGSKKSIKICIKDDREHFFLD